jgi:hypothetical protein
MTVNQTIAIAVFIGPSFSRGGCMPPPTISHPPRDRVMTVGLIHVHQRAAQI